MPWLPSTLIPRRPGCTCRELGRVPRGCRASGRGAPKSQCDSVPRSSGEDPTNAGRAITESRAGPFTRGSTGSVSTCPEERSAVYAGRSWTALGSPVQHAARVVLAAMLVHVAPLAQLAEQLALNQRVRGSSPWRRTSPHETGPSGSVSAFCVATHVATQKPRRAMSTRKPGTAPARGLGVSGRQPFIFPPLLSWPVGC